MTQLYKRINIPIKIYFIVRVENNNLNFIVMKNLPSNNIMAGQLTLKLCATVIIYSIFS